MRPKLYQYEAGTLYRRNPQAWADMDQRLDKNPSKVGAYFSVLAAKYLWYGVPWYLDEKVEDLRSMIHKCNSVALRASYIAEMIQ